MDLDIHSKSQHICGDQPRLFWTKGYKSGFPHCFRPQLALFCKEGTLNTLHRLKPPLGNNFASVKTPKSTIFFLGNSLQVPSHKNPYFSNFSEGLLKRIIQNLLQKNHCLRHFEIDLDKL